ncbi:hypothetical protein PVK06_036850 [Gossypium arboreum]|uniref:Uncharacterized protein n=1 Tax=Gossypium arboreum TaxID=29729 RepID=A0ABR0NKM2_GOSAR|nr:hypothetical protein PVK06_036850 [Gossypium arboreum]
MASICIGSMLNKIKKANLLTSCSTASISQFMHKHKASIHRKKLKLLKSLLAPLFSIIVPSLAFVFILAYVAANVPTNGN